VYYIALLLLACATATGAGQVLIYSNLDCSGQPTVIESVEPALINATNVPYGQCVSNPNTTSSFINAFDDDQDYYEAYMDDYYYSYYYTYYSSGYYYGYYYDNETAPIPIIPNITYPNASGWFSFDMFKFMMLQCSEDTDVPISGSSAVLR
jgi:hypothetical protein